MLHVSVELRVPGSANTGGGDVYVLHLIAFLVIGVVIGYILGRGAKSPWIAVILGLIGSFAGGELLHTHRYLSLVAAVVGAIILGYVGKALAGQSR
jgi:uncharacterized membrane protein YeaQ/YmgE (transglycosylase-associated protein family)